MANEEVRVGQVWADNDKRSTNRKVRVISIELGSALVEPVTVTPQGAVARVPGRPTRIRLDRFRPTATGYRLISQGEA